MPLQRASGLPVAAEKKLKICLVSSELAPFAKTGGLADVCGALSAYMHNTGHDMRVLVPRYSKIDTDGLDVVAVGELQNLSIRIGPWDIPYSIDAVTMPRTDLLVYLLRCPEMYNRAGLYTQDGDEHLRFLLLSRVAIELCQRMQFAPDVFHCNDWQTSLIPLYLRTIYAWDKLFANTRTALTIHNIGYQGVFSADILPDLDLGDDKAKLHQDDLNDGRINFLKTGLLYANVLTTVSPTYAREIQGPEYGAGLDGMLRNRAESVVGILNGVDYSEWNPATDSLIPHNYGPENLRGKTLCKKKLMAELGLAGGKEVPLIGIVSRLAGQKGFGLMEGVLPRLLAKENFSLAVLGSGELRYETFFGHLQDRFPGRVAFYRGFNNRLAHWIEAGSDMFLMPSLYEPCGLNQMYSLKYGTVPIVRETGGLADSVELVNPGTGKGTGVLFRDYNEDGLSWAIRTALLLYENKRLWRKIIRNGMSTEFSWERQGELYVELFRQLSNS